jgi:hypothetical protein
MKYKFVIGLIGSPFSEEVEKAVEKGWTPVSGTYVEGDTTAGAIMRHVEE